MPGIVLCIIFNLILIGLIAFGGYSYIKEKSNTMVVVAATVPDKKPEVIKNSDFINIKEFIPELIYEPRYKTDTNVTGKVLYSKDYPYLRYGTAVKLKKAWDKLSQMGIRIKIWDAYRPPSVQKLLWQKVSDSRFIANPATGSVHNRGAAVDMTLVDREGKEVKMPSGFDEFDSKADRDFKDIDTERAANAKVLEGIMKECGFESITTEWWHFNDTDWREYGIVQDVKDSSVKKSGYSLEVSGSEIKQPDFRDELNNFIVWAKDKAGEISIQSVASGLKSQYYRIKGFFNDMINT
jgi:D-alanyl-D-alanine dipeptidase